MQFYLQNMYLWSKGFSNVSSRVSVKAGICRRSDVAWESCAICRGWSGLFHVLFQWSKWEIEKLSMVFKNRVALDEWVFFILICGEEKKIRLWRLKMRFRPPVKYGLLYLWVRNLCFVLSTSTCSSWCLLRQKNTFILVDNKANNFCH